MVTDWINPDARFVWAKGVHHGEVLGRVLRVTAQQALVEFKARRRSLRNQRWVSLERLRAYADPLN